MFSSEVAPLLFVTMAICGGGSGSSSSSSDRLSPSGWTCGDLQLMLELEARIGTECFADWQCDEVVPETGECPTDDLILNSSYESDSFYDLLSEADAIDCRIDFGTSGDCPDDASPACLGGYCGWY